LAASHAIGHLTITPFAATAERAVGFCQRKFSGPSYQSAGDLAIVNDHGNSGTEPIGRIQQQSLRAPQRPRSNELFWAVFGFAAKGKHKMELCGSDQRFDAAAIKREFPSANFQVQISEPRGLSFASSR